MPYFVLIAAVTLTSPGMTHKYIPMKNAKKQCVLHANCQAEPLLELLSLSAAFCRFYETRLFTNYTKEDLPDDALANCDLFLYQHLDESWGNLSSGTLLGKLGPQAQSICLPNMFFKGYWPFWTSISPIDFGDSLLDRFIDAGADKDVIIKLYYYSDIGKYADIQQIADDSLALEQAKDARSPVKVYALLQEFWQSEMMFYTCNHPAKRLLVHVANELLFLLGLPRLNESDISGYMPEYANFELPVHPQVASALNLKFIGEEHKFRVFDREFNFLQYLSRYIDCRKNGFSDGFLGYLQLV